jgi:glycosyltransferase involved in cell wall biosynthesis
VNTTAELTIVIPAKNEARNLPLLLTSLSMQDYPLLQHMKVFVADANSTDDTLEVARSFSDRLSISVIPGGLPSVGRNAGARLADSTYVLFIDADIELRDPTLLRRAMQKMKRRGLHCLTTNIRCSGGRGMDHALYAGNNIVQRVSSWTKPFSTGMFMLFEKARFDALGGFDERALYAEDYLLSKQVSPRRFGLVRGHVLTSNRRFRKMGHWRIARMFLKTAFNTWNYQYFLRDQGYWKEV